MKQVGSQSILYAKAGPLIINYFQVCIILGIMPRQKHLLFYVYISVNGFTHSNVMI